MEIQIRIERPRWLRLPRRRSAKLGLALVAALVVAVPFAWADHTFPDVPASSPHHADVTSIRVAGITQGCNPPANTLYCPAEPVRRDQMASFLQRGLGRTARGVGSGGFTPLTGTNQTIATATLTVPGSGFVLVNAMATILTASGCPCMAELRLRDTATGAASPPQYQTATGTGVPTGYTNAALTYVFPVGPGASSFVLEARSFSGTGSYGPFNAVVDALWVPFGSTGSSTLGSAEPPASPTSGPPGVR